ncbi:MAG: dihydropteroate synthase [Phycisphaerae bacterium]|nr:dihydropteroate synthase [Phycisphaerae bacterium]
MSARATIDEILTSHHSGRAVMMGILNITPDSFSDGGEFFDPPAARARALRMLEEGADVIDIGAESTRPGSAGVGPGDQIHRLRDVLPAVAETGAPVSIDTTSAEVAAFALEAGAAIINDVSAGRDDPRILSLAAERKSQLVLMHMLGRPRTMQDNPHYDDVVAEVREFLAGRIEAAEEAGVERGRIIVDPGIGFGKRLEHNLALLAGGVGAMLELGRPVLVGPSRKRFIGELTGPEGASRRLGGTLAACLVARRRGASIFRVHDVGPVVEALKVFDAIEGSPAVGGHTAD